MKQKTERPKIEDVLTGTLEGDTLLNARSFVLFLVENKMKPVWASANSWKASCKGKGICYIRLHGTAHYHNLSENSWHICFINYGYTGLVGDSDEHISSDEQLKEIVWDNIRFCTKCSNCKRGNVVDVFGKQFDEVCHRWLVMETPNSEVLNCAKKIVLARKQEITKIAMQV